MKGEANRKFNRRNMILTVGAMVIALAAGGGWWWYHASGMVSSDDARVKGTIVSVSSKVPGRIEQVFVNEGDIVQPGQEIAKIESAEYEVQVAQAKANLAAAEAKLASTKAGNRPQQVAQAGAGITQAEANLDNAKKVYERSQLLFEKGALSAQQRDSAETALEVAQAQYDAAVQSYSLTAEGSRTEDVQMAQAQVDQATAALKNAQLQLDNTSIKAPTAGTIALKSVDTGEIVAAGQSLFNITDPADVWIAANIEETYIGKVQVGQSVSFTIDAYPHVAFKGEVSEVGSATGSQFALLPTENTSGNFTKVTQRLPIKIKPLAAAGYALKPGMSAVVDIQVR